MLNKWDNRTFIKIFIEVYARFKHLKRKIFKAPFFPKSNEYLTYYIYEG